MKRFLPLVIAQFTLFAQSNAQHSSIIPPSPVSAEFEKYVNYEVSLVNGIPEISIPLYNIQIKGISVPISLSYHASGIKFEQESGDVGLGWVLNPGYRISRTILDYADENTIMPEDIIGTLNSYENMGQLARDEFLSKFTEDDDFGITEQLDGQFDQFTFSTPSISGGFIISNRSNKTILTNEASNLKFDYVLGSSSLCSNIDGIKGFQIIDDLGMKYSFGEYFPQSTCAIERNNNNNPYSENAGVAWGLAEIENLYGEKITFRYMPGTVGGIGVSKSVTITEGSLFNGCSVSNVSSNYQFNDYYSTFFPSEILTPNERIVFTRISQYDNRINTIQIYSINNDPIKNIKFYYHNGNYNGYFIKAYYLLDSLTISDQNDQRIETYSFDYYSGLPGFYVMASDQFGFCKLGGSTQGVYFHNTFSDDEILIREEPNYETPQLAPRLFNTCEDKVISREGETEVPNVLSLKRINYPTGGYTEYEYESNNILESTPYNPRTETAGLRIKKIISSDLINNEALIRSYSYGEGESGYGQANLFIDNTFFVKEGLNLDFLIRLECNGGEGFQQRVVAYSSNLQGDIGSIVNSSSFVRYPCVTEYHSSSISGNGKTVYYYDIGNPYTAASLDVTNSMPNGLYYSSPHHITRYGLWDKPVLTRKEVYDNMSVLKKKEEFHYQKTFNSFNGLKVEKFATITPYLWPYFQYYAPVDNYYLNSYFNYGIYSYEVGRTELKQKKNYEYHNGQTILTEYVYEYSNLLMSKESITRSRGDNYVNFTTYPLDYGSGTAFIDYMNSNNVIAAPVEKVLYLDNGSMQTIISGTIIQYKSDGKGLIETQLNLENSTGINLPSFKFSNRSFGVLPPFGSPTGYSPDYRYTRKVTYDSYDSKGNLLQMHSENDINVCYLWGYNQTYPVVKIEGLSYDAIPTSIKTNIEGHSFTSSSSYLEVKNDVDFLKAQLDDIMNNTSKLTYLYTYKPLIGMTSQTDPNGTTTYYEYDPFGRLKSIKDHDGRILKTYEYQYNK